MGPMLNERPLPPKRRLRRPVPDQKDNQSILTKGAAATEDEKQRQSTSASETNLVRGLAVSKHAPHTTPCTRMCHCRQSVYSNGTA